MNTWRLVEKEEQMGRWGGGLMRCRSCEGEMNETCGDIESMVGYESKRSPPERAFAHSGDIALKRSIVAVSFGRSTV